MVLGWFEYEEKNEYILMYSEYPGIEGRIIGNRDLALEAAIEVANHQNTIVDIYKQIGAELVCINRIHPAN